MNKAGVTRKRENINSRADDRSDMRGGPATPRWADPRAAAFRIFFLKIRWWDSHQIVAGRQASLDDSIASTKGHEQIHPQAGHARHFRRRTGAACQIGESRFRVSERAREKFAFGPVELEREGEIVTMFPSVCWQQGAASG